MFAIRLNENLRLLGLDSTFLWMYEHPTVVKTLRVAGLILGGALFGSIIWEFPLLRMREIVGRLLTSALVTLVTLVFTLFLDLFIPPSRSAKPHVYKTGACEGGRLEYRGQVPLLILQTEDSFKMGRAQGKLCGSAIDQMAKRLATTHLSGKKEEIPPDLLPEMKGIVAGYEEWRKTQYWWKFPMKMNLDDLRDLHAKLEQIRPACSATIDCDPRGEGTVFSLEFATSSFGFLETFCLLIDRQDHSISAALPGSIGVIAGMNQSGLCVADSPSFLINRGYLNKFSDTRRIQYGAPLIAADPQRGIAGLEYWRIFYPLIIKPEREEGSETVLRLEMRPSQKTLRIKGTSISRNHENSGI